MQVQGPCTKFAPLFVSSRLQAKPDAKTMLRHVERQLKIHPEPREDRARVVVTPTRLSERQTAREVRRQRLDSTTGQSTSKGLKMAELNVISLAVKFNKIGPSRLQMTGGFLIWPQNLNRTFTPFLARQNPAFDNFWPLFSPKRGQMSSD